MKPFSRTPVWLLPVLLIAATFAFRHFWSIAYWLVPTTAVGGEPTVSDKIAAASAFFSVLALVSLVYTILLQREQLSSQRADQIDLRAEVAEQREYVKRQTDAQTQQAFENTFFHLLKLHNDNVNSQLMIVTADENRITLLGRAAFHAAAEALTEHMSEFNERFDSDMTLEDLNNAYASICETPDSDFGHYFRNLYHIIKYVDESDVRDKYRYAAQVRAQISQSEFEVLFVNGLRKHGKSKFKLLIEKYALLHEMRVRGFSAHFSEYYNASAFGNS